MKPWLSLYEIFLSYNLEHFRGSSFKTRKTTSKLILDRKDFCKQEDKWAIYNTPPDYVRMRFLLTQFNINEDLSKDILNFIKYSASKGYPINGKSCRGILAGAIYLHSKQENLMLTQNTIVKKLGVTEVTLRARKKELQRFLIDYKTHLNEKDKPIKSEKVKKTIKFKDKTILDFL